MLNKAILMGRLVAEPELRHTPNNIAVASFTLAVDRTYGQDKQTDFLDRGLAFYGRIRIQVVPQGNAGGGKRPYPDPKLGG